MLRQPMPDLPHTVWMPGGSRTEIHLTAEDTDGAFCLLVDNPEPDWSLPPHRHRDEAETIHVVEGEFEIVVDGTPHRLAAGDTVHVPRGVLHSSANVGGVAGRRVLLFNPAGMERFFLEAGADASERAITPAATMAVAARHGWEFPAQG